MIHWFAAYRIAVVVPGFRERQLEAGPCIFERRNRELRKAEIHRAVGQCLQHERIRGRGPDGVFVGRERLREHEHIAQPEFGTP